MKKIIVFFALAIMLFNGATVHANTQKLSPEELTYRINSLLAQLASLQALLAERQSGVTISGKPSITITEPSPFMTVKYGDQYSASWDTKNIPANSMLLMETKAAQLYGGSGVAGGFYQQAIAPGNTTGTRTITTGVGRSSPGTYDMRVLVVACLDLSCSKSPITYDSMGGAIYQTKVHATSDWVRFSITENKELESTNTGAVTITKISPTEGKFRLGEKMKISYVLSGSLLPGQEACFMLQSATGKRFSPNSNTYSACAPAKTGLNERTWTPFRTSGFNLEPGLYKITLEVPNPPSTSGKDAGNTAKGSSNWIELLPEA